MNETNSNYQRVDTQFFTFARSPEDAFVLESGEKFGPITLAYETYGTLSPSRDNAILVFHALSGSHHAAGYNPRVPGAEKFWTDECHVGWWESFIGPGKALDTRKYFVICANYFGGCYGSTGPASITPETGKPYGGKFPFLTTTDIVNTQLRLLDHLGIRTLLAAVGGSLGGVLAHELAMRNPERVRCVISIGSGPHATTLHVISNHEQIRAIEWDPNFNHGDYYDGQAPNCGMALARMISHKTFVHLHLMEERARAEIVQPEELNGYRMTHRIESYMLHAGQKFVKRFDANTYLRIVAMWQRFDLAAHTEHNLVKAFDPCKHLRFLIFSIDEDVCFWPEEQAELCDALKRLGADYHHITVHSEKGHDSFLLEPEKYRANISDVLQKTYREIDESNFKTRDVTGSILGAGI